ncbi:MAG: integration host factor subunit beta [Deltaproteobacteria bacterium]|nr:integration host factor subunit beta [Deltaproteobacteria bacterium]
MKKSDLIQIVAEKRGISVKLAEDVINIILSSMKDALAKGNRIELRGFGSFWTKSYESYTGRNPKTGERINVKPKRLPVFKVGRELQKRINGGKLDK